MAAAGMLAPTAEANFQEEELLNLERESLSLYPDFVAELEEASGQKLGYRTEGTLIVAVDRDDAEAIEHYYQFYRRLDLEAHRLVGPAIHELEPGLSPTINYALFLPRDHQIDPICLVQALAKAFVRAGGYLYEDSPVEAVLLHENEREIRGLRLMSGEEYFAPHLLLAAGAWSRKIPGIPSSVLPHIRPIRGQMIAIESGDPPLIEHVVRAPDAYLVPKSDGRLLIGSTMEERGFDPRLTAGGLMDLLEGAWEAVPGIYDAHIIDTWTGFRPMTLANKPVLGTTALKGLHLSVGHGRNGIMLAPVTAYGLAKAIDCGQPPRVLATFSPRS